MIGAFFNANSAWHVRLAERVYGEVKVTRFNRVLIDIQDTLPKRERTLLYM